jgi:hypothetical protein
MKSRTATVLIASICRDGGTQIRAALDESTVADYAAAVKAGAELPPVTVHFDGKVNWLSDGFHRVEAALRGGKPRIQATVVKGTQRDAILAACGANSTHGLRRSNADKRRAVETLLADKEWSEWSDRRIAKELDVSNHLVSELRATIDDRTQQSGNSPTLSRVKDSKPGQPTAAIPPSAANPALEGDDETGGLGTEAKQVIPATPVSSIDLLGIDGIDPGWLALAEDVVAALDAFDGHLRSAQSAVHNDPGDMLAGDMRGLRQAAHDLAARARQSVRPRSVCPYCKDPDGEAGRREECNGCRGLGWLTTEQLTAVPRELLVRGEAAKVINTKSGGYVPREVVVERDDEDDEGLAF